MARIARIVIPGLPHHVTQHGVRSMKVFSEKSDPVEYLSLIKKSCAKAKTEILAYCLMPDHVHFIMVPSHEDGLRAALGDAHRRYTRMINARQKCRGHLWQERFHSFVMGAQDATRRLRPTRLTVTKLSPRIWCGDSG